MTQTRFDLLIGAGVLEIGDGYRAKNEELGGTGAIFLRAGHVSDTRIDFSDAERFWPHRAPAFASKLSRSRDTIITTKGNSTGRTSYVTPDMPPFVYSPHLSYWRSLKPDELVPGFLRYWARGPEFHDQLNAMKGSTDMAPYLSLTDQRRLRISLPDTRTQEAIASLLGALDSKIDQNHQLGRKLDEVSSTLFESWFVDFDPVQAKHEGRAPAGVPDTLLPHFAEHFEDSCVGPIPRGWSISTIGEEVRVVGGSTPRTNEPAFWNGDVCWVTPKDLARLSDRVVLASERFITPMGLSQISSGLLPRGTVLLSSRAPIGYLAVAELPVAVNQGFIAMVCDGRLPSLWVLRWTFSNMDEVFSRAGGTTFEEISKTAFRPIPVVVPPEPVVAAYELLASPLHERLVACVRETEALKTMRDALIPALLSGAMTVGQAENAASEVA